eukprot:11974608-Karenia_brevis.AAC.1
MYSTSVSGEEIQIKFPSSPSNQAIDSRGGATDITVDSGAEESVCPWEWGQQFGTKSIGVFLNLRNASGVLIPHSGSRAVE